MKKLFTLGSERIKRHVFWSILAENRITHLLDIRRDNKHFGSMFNRDRLQTLCDEAGIIYLHEPRLAPSRSLLNAERDAEKGIKKLYPWPDKNERAGKPGLLGIIRDKRRLARLHYYQGSFKETYLSEIQAGHALDVLLKRVEETSRPCLLAKNEFSKLHICYRKMLTDLFLDTFPNRYKVMHLIETFYHQGQVHDLRRSFQDVSRVYFDNSLSPSEVAFSWSSRLPSGESGVFWGGFEPPNRILINEVLDSQHVPSFFVNAIMYHELIHYRRFRDGLPYDHLVDFYLEELDFAKVGADFHFRREWLEKHLPLIKEEVERAKIPREEYELKMEALRNHLEQIRKRKVREDDNQE